MSWTLMAQIVILSVVGGVVVSTVVSSTLEAYGKHVKKNGTTYISK